MLLIFNTQNEGIVRIQIKESLRLIDEEDLTLDQDFDSMLIKVLDRLFSSNKIERLSLKSVKISGKIKSKALWGMILGATKGALEV